MFSWQEQYLTCSLRSLVRYCSCHSNIKFISSRHRVISSIYAIDRQFIVGPCGRDFGMATVNNQAIECIQVFMFNMLILTLTPKKLHNLKKQTSYVQNKNRDDDTCAHGININRVAQNKNLTYFAVGFSAHDKRNNA